MKKGIKFFLLTIIFVCIFASCGKESRTRLPEKYSFTVKGVTFSVGDDADVVTKSLGEENSFSSAPSCAGIGADELYVYNGFKITAHRAEDKAKITAIEITNDTLPTVEGVYIGSSEESVRGKYGEGSPFSGGVEYRSDVCRLRFFITDGRVTGIKYLENGT